MHLDATGWHFKLSVQDTHRRKGNKEKEMKDFEAYSIGICNASVCSSLTLEEITKRLNERYPTGIASQWTLSEDKQFHSGQPHPCPCEENPETHMHYLFHC
jgi:hypothetical protein